MYSSKIRDKIEDMFVEKIRYHQENIRWYKRRMETCDDYHKKAFQDHANQEEIRIAGLRDLMRESLVIFTDDLRS
jgi:hypothetical protein